MSEFQKQEHKKLICEYLQELNQNVVLNVSDDQVKLSSVRTIDILTEDLAIIIMTSYPHYIKANANFYRLFFSHIIKDRVLVFYIYNVCKKNIKDINLSLKEKKVKGIFSAKASTLKIIQHDTVKNILNNLIKEQRLGNKFKIASDEMKINKKLRAQMRKELDENIKQQSLQIDIESISKIKCSKKLEQLLFKHQELTAAYQEIRKRINEMDEIIKSFILDCISIMKTWVEDIDLYLHNNSVLNDNICPEHIICLQDEKHSLITTINKLSDNNLY